MARNDAIPQRKRLAMGQDLAKGGAVRPAAPSASTQVPPAPAASPLQKYGMGYRRAPSRK